MTNRYPVVFEAEDSGAVSAYVPGLPVYAAADTADEAEDAIRELLYLVRRGPTDAWSRPSRTTNRRQGRQGDDRRRRLERGHCQPGRPARPAPLGKKGRGGTSEWPPGRSPGRHPSPSLAPESRRATASHRCQPQRARHRFQELNRADLQLRRPQGESSMFGAACVENDVPKSFEQWLARMERDSGLRDRGRYTVSRSFHHRAS